MQALGLSFLLAVFAAAILWFFATFVPDRRVMAIESWRRELSLRADLRRDLLDRRVSDVTENLTFFASFPSVRGLLTPGQSEEAAAKQATHLSEILSDFRRVYHLRSISILDPSGRVVVSSDGPAPDAAALAVATERIPTGTPGVDLAVGQDRGAELVSVVPVSGGEARAGLPRVLGELLAVGDASTLLFDLLGGPVAASSSESVLVREDGKDVLFLSPLRFRADPPLTFRLPLATAGLAAGAALAGKEDFREFVDYRGARVLAAVRELKDVPWGVVVKVDEDEALAAFRKDVIQRGITWGALLLALTAAAVGFWRSLVITNEAKLARSEARFGALVEEADDAIFLLDPEGRVLDANRRAERMYGADRATLLGWSAADLRAPDEREGAAAAVEKLNREGRNVVTTVHQHVDGSTFPVEIRSRRIQLGTVDFLLAIVRDVTARKASEDRIRGLNRLLRTITEVNQLLVRATNEESLLKDVCRILVLHGGYALAWVGRADRETMRVVPVASAGDKTGYLQRIEVRWDDTPEGQGPLGIAIREGRSAIVSDVQADPMVVPWRRAHPSPGFGSIAAIPIRRGGAVTAGLIVYSEVKAFIDEEELALLEELAGDVSFALDALDAREALRRSEAGFQKLWRAVEQTPATVVITDLEGRIEYVNPRFTQVTGYTTEEALGQNPRILKSERTPPEVYRTMWETITAGRVWQGELCNRKKDGTLFWEYASISPVRDEQGATTSYVAVKEDITARKKAAEDLAKSEAYFRSIIENSRDVIAVLDPYGALRYASPSVEPTFGYKPEELVGRPIFEFIHPEDRERAGSRLRRVVLEGATPEKLEVRFGHRDGSWRTLSVLGNRLPPEAGVVGMVVNARDLTELHQLEAQFRQAQKMEAVGRLAGGVAHDFNNLLTVIQGYGELLATTLEGDPEKRESVGEIVKAAERASALTRQLLAFSRQQVLEMRVLDIGAVVADTEKMLKRLIGEDVEVVVVKTATLGRVKADPGQIEQVIINLAVNARDAMPGGGRLTVGLSDVDLEAPLAGAQDSIPPGRYVVLSIADTGGGMDAETLAHIFEPFFTTKEKGKGTGLGLATVYGIVRQTGGYVAVETSRGAGTRFRVYLPRCDEEKTSGVRPSVLSRRGTETVLVVEDEPAVRGLAKVVLERRGYTVLVAENGDAALDVVTRDPRPVHVLLTDLLMPGMNGRELASRLVALRPSIKVVFMSGYAADIGADLVADGESGFLSKPFTERALTAKIREVLDAPPA